MTAAWTRQCAFSTGTSNRSDANLVGRENGRYHEPKRLFTFVSQLISKHRMSPTQNNQGTAPFSCLLVDDDLGFAGMLAKLVAEEGGHATKCHTLAAARAEIERRAFDIAILDNCLPDGTGYEFYPQIVRRKAATVAVMITGAPELPQAVELTRNGLFDYLTKPMGAPEFLALLKRVKLRLRHSESENQPDEMAGDSAAMKEVVWQLRQAARHVKATVLLLGETGTGKDLAARLLHKLTFPDSSSKAPFVALNCPNVPMEMFEAELFGSEKGSYTGADRRRTGLVEAAEGGTLFLDEIAEIPLGLQSKLLRFLESREYRSLGSTGTSQFTGRVIAATNRSLPEEVRAGRFREDLMYRLDVFSVRLPPLREHLADIESIAANLLAQLCVKYQRVKPSLRPEDFDALKNHSFPGNIRELRNLLERSLLRSEETASELALDLCWLKGRSAASSTPSPEPNTNAFPPATRQLTPLEEQEYQLIAQALRMEKGGIRRAAAKLGLTHQALLRRLQKWPELRQAATSSP
jgi:DNA-binding NtrC family response regulator